VADRLVEILPRHGADQPLVLDDEDAALPVPLAGDHGVRHGLVGADAARRTGHQVAGGERGRGLAERLLEPLLRLGEAPAVDRRRRLRMASAAEHAREHGRVELGCPAADDGEDTVVHLHEQHERPAVGEVDELVREVRDPVDVGRPLERRDEHFDAGRLDGLEAVEQRVQQLALGLAERRVQVARDQVLTGAVTQAPAERLRVTLRRARVGQRPGVLVDPERKGGRLDAAHGKLALGEDADERGRKRAVLGDHHGIGRDPLRELATRVVVEDHLLDRGVEGNALELAEPRGVNRLDDDQAADRLQLEPRRVDELELLGVEPRELSHVAVERPREADDRVRVEPARREERPERVEVGVPVRRDDRRRLHRLEF
jgi:hypothetical protein